MGEQGNLEARTTRRQAEARTFLLTTAGLATTTWGIAFNLGAFQTVFFRHLFAAWVIVTTILIAAFILPGKESTVPWWGKIVLLVPSLAMVFSFFEPFVPMNTQWAPSILVSLSSVAVLVCLPYAGYVVVSITSPGVLQLRRLRLRLALVAILIIVFGSGYWVGRNNALFLTCGDFTISGEDTPGNCRPGPPTRF